MDLIIKMQFGSHLYGTATEKSDIDYKGIYLPSAEDILLQKIKKSICNKRNKQKDEKNSPGELDEEYYSLGHFCQMLMEGQTVSLDMFFVPANNIITQSSIWVKLKELKNCFLSKQYASFVGYCRTQANKYGIKGSRMAAIRKAIELLEQNGLLLKDGYLSSWWEEIKKLTAECEHMEIVYITQKDGTDLPYWQICGRKFSKDVKIKIVYECLQKILDEYGQRAILAEKQEGIDWKALSHAVRIGHQAIELLTTGHITFPLVNKDHILNIKNGNIKYQIVAEEIENLLDNVELASQKSTLPEKPDKEKIEKFLIECYREKICNENKSH